MSALLQEYPIAAIVVGGVLTLVVIYGINRLTDLFVDSGH